ncbi:glycosyltransferase [Nocardioides sp.]|uniref:glycosyltransferase n=1 Tax=Nocardioides sp. TaxID=35761 RepID=UPI002B7F2FD1|nr:glycosyltransferase [Nocardioides sp.]HXH79100.1 glycosyltransferase [Nocardioides sp.]
MIGYYVHHVGRGHLHRAQALAVELEAHGEQVTGLSSLERPAGWPGEWVRLPRDDEVPDATARDVTANGRLHWAPLRDDGLRARMAAVSAWIGLAHPDLMVVDVSVELVLLSRLHGVPTLAVVLPGRRDDPAHALGFEVADALVSFWPADVTGMTHGLSAAALERLVPVGAMSRHPVRSDALPVRRSAGRRRVVVLLGTGGHDVSAADIQRARRTTPGWDWTVLDGSPDTWVVDPSAVLADAHVVVTHAGQNAIAETATARRPAVVIPQARPHDEQLVTATVLGSGWPAVVCATWPATGWPDLLDRAGALDGQHWSRWCDGRAGVRFAELALRVRGEVAVGAQT